MPKVPIVIRKGPSTRTTEAGMVCGAKRIGATTFLCRQEGTPSFPPRPRPKARPPSPLSMPRLCAFAEQTSVPHTTRHRPTPEAGMVSETRRIKSHLAPREIRNRFKAQISKHQDCHTGVSVIEISILFRASKFEFRVFPLKGRRVRLPPPRSPRRLQAGGSGHRQGSAPALPGR